MDTNWAIGPVDTHLANCPLSESLEPKCVFLFRILEASGSNACRGRSVEPTARPSGLDQSMAMPIGMMTQSQAADAHTYEYTHSFQHFKRNHGGFDSEADTIKSDHTQPWSGQQHFQFNSNAESFDSTSGVVSAMDMAAQHVMLTLLSYMHLIHCQMMAATTTKEMHRAAPQRPPGTFYVPHLPKKESAATCQCSHADLDENIDTTCRECHHAEQDEGIVAATAATTAAAVAETDVDMNTLCAADMAKLSEGTSADEQPQQPIEYINGSIVAEAADANDINECPKKAVITDGPHTPFNARQFRQGNARQLAGNRHQTPLSSTALRSSSLAPPSIAFAPSWAKAPQQMTSN